MATVDNPKGDRYSLEIDIISAEIDIEGNGQTFPFIETLKSVVIDHKTGERIEGMIGNSFSSYVRDYDFSVVLPQLGCGVGEKPEDFGDLHGKLYQHWDKKIYIGNPYISLFNSAKDVWKFT